MTSLNPHDSEVGRLSPAEEAENHKMYVNCLSTNAFSAVARCIMSPACLLLLNEASPVRGLFLIPLTFPVSDTISHICVFKE